jgi:hypothetical protein
MNSLDMLLIGAVVGLMVALRRSTTVIVPPVVPEPAERGDGCLLPVALLLIMLLGFALLASGNL